MKQYGYMELRDPDEASEHLLQHIRGLVDYWASLEHQTKQDAMEGMVFSMLTTFDGCSGDMPPYILKEMISTPNGDDWIDGGAELGGTLHERWVTMSPSTKHSDGRYAMCRIERCPRCGYDVSIYGDQGSVCPDCKYMF